MKKLILASSLLCAVFALKADLVLCWTTPDSSTQALGWWGQMTTIGNATNKAGDPLGAVSYAKLGYFADNSAREYADYVANGDYAMGFDESTYTASSSIAQLSDGAEGWAVIDPNNYYYIALFDASDNLVAYSQTFNSASVVSSSIDTSKWSSVESFAGAFAGSGYAVPEPTSGLLVLLGMAGLALRRRKIA